MQGSHEVATGLSSLDGCERKEQPIGEPAQRDNMNTTGDTYRHSLRTVPALGDELADSTLQAVFEQLTVAEAALADARERA